PGKLVRSSRWKSGPSKGQRPFGSECCVTHYGVSFNDLIKGGLHLISLFGQDAVLATTSRSGKIEPTARYQQTYEAVGDSSWISSTCFPVILAIFLDPLARVLKQRAPEVAPGDIKRFAKDLFGNLERLLNWLWRRVRRLKTRRPGRAPLGQDRAHRDPPNMHLDLRQR